MGFPAWTLWGMGISAAGALLFITLSWLGQSPLLLRRLGLASLRIGRRVRAFTGFALASLLLAIAFFLAGVPLGTTPETEELAQQEAPADVNAGATTDSNESEVAATASQTASPLTPETGAFSGPPAARHSPESEGSSLASGEARQTEVSSSAGPAEPPTNTAAAPNPQPSPSATIRPTQTPTPIATATPYPTLTPTTIAGPTAVISTSGSTLWLRRSPGGQNLTLVRDGDVVLVRSGRASQGGLLWRQVATVAGVEGWLQEQFLLIPEPE